MGLTEYLTEYVSSGKKSIRLIDFPDRDLTIENLSNWFDLQGIKGYSMTIDRTTDPPVNPGELAYFVGRCDRRPDTHWVALYNNLGFSGTKWTQEVVIWTKRQPHGRLTTRGEKPLEITVEEAAELMKAMVLDPKHRVRL